MGRTVYYAGAALIALGGMQSAKTSVDQSLFDGWAWQQVSMVGSAPAPPPTPSPTPDTPDVGICTNCNGTGKLPGDGRIKPNCPECGGTGKITAARSPDCDCDDCQCVNCDCVAMPLTDSPAPAYRTVTTYKQVCDGNSCRLVPVTTRVPVAAPTTTWGSTSATTSYGSSGSAMMGSNSHGSHGMGDSHSMGQGMRSRRVGLFRRLFGRRQSSGMH